MALPTSSSQLIDRFGIISDQVETRELTVLLDELQHCLLGGVHGSVVEFGCYTGTTSLFIRRLLDAYSGGEFHVYDSFAGLPEKLSQDMSPVGEQFRAGELLASKKQFVVNFKKAGLELPRIHKGWFKDLTPDDVPENIAFAFLDGDYYDSIMQPLKLIWPRLTPHATVVIDDYNNAALPGARSAVDEWIMTHPARIQSVHSLAVIRT